MAHNCRKENPIIRGSDAYSLLLEMDSAIHENGASEGCLIRIFLSLLLNTLQSNWKYCYLSYMNNESLCFGGKVEHSTGTTSYKIFAEVFVLWLLSNQITLPLSLEILQFL